jgi:hypothetical protein
LKKKNQIEEKKEMYHTKNKTKSTLAYVPYFENKKQEVLGRTNRLLSIDTTRTA